jgi:hypothetical protein
MRLINIWSPSGTNSMEQRPSSEAIEEILTFSQTKVHYHVHKTPLLVPVPDRVIQSTPTHLKPLQSILILSSHIHLYKKKKPSFADSPP